MSYSIADKVAQETAHWKRVCGDCGKPFATPKKRQVRCDDCIKAQPDCNKSKALRATKKRYIDEKRKDPAFVAKEIARCKLYRERKRAEDLAIREASGAAVRKGDASLEAVALPSSQTTPKIPTEEALASLPAIAGSTFHKNVLKLKEAVRKASSH